MKSLWFIVPWEYEIEDLNGKNIVGIFYEKELQKSNETDSRIERNVKRKGGELNVKWKGYANSFNSCIDKKDIAI